MDLVDTILSLKKISKHYGRINAVKAMSLDIGQGQVFGLLGPNGSGKTTTLGIILGVTRPDSGSYQWFGRNPAAKQRRRIGALIEQPNFYSWLTGFQNLRVTAAIRGVKTASINDAMQTAGIWDRRNDKYRTYSLGMKQRLGLASTMVGDPDVLVLDEPTNGVDARGIADIRNMILKIASRGKTVILASHILDEVEKVCDHVAVLRDGEVLESGNTSSVLNPGDLIEVAADEMNILAEKLESFPGLKKIARASGLLNLTVTPEIKTGDLNQYLYEQGIVLTHLSRKKRSLESRFLELLDDERK